MHGQLFAGNAAQLSNHVGHEQSPTFEQCDLIQWSFHCKYKVSAYKNIDSFFFYRLGTGFSLQISNAAADLSLDILPDVDHAMEILTRQERTAHSIQCDVPASMFAVEL